MEELKEAKAAIDIAQKDPWWNRLAASMKSVFHSVTFDLFKARMKKHLPYFKAAIIDLSTTMHNHTASPKYINYPSQNFYIKYQNSPDHNSELSPKTKKEYEQEIRELGDEYLKVVIQNLIPTIDKYKKYFAILVDPQGVFKKETYENYQVSFAKAFEKIGECKVNWGSPNFMNIITDVLVQHEHKNSDQNINYIQSLAETASFLEFFGDSDKTHLNCESAAILETTLNTSGISMNEDKGEIVLETKPELM